MAMVVLLVVACREKPADQLTPSEPTAPVSAAADDLHFVGSTSCAGCHAEAFAAWQASQHAQAMQEADPRSVLGDFIAPSATARSDAPAFTAEGGRYFVQTPGPGGEPARYEVKYTFGIDPLQQLLVDFGGGRLQAFDTAWDSRPKAAGGQRWFSLDPDHALRPGDPLHWTGIDQTWNYQCADCHSTNLRKNYDEGTDAYASSWSEIHVGCEACHGPGSRHMAWAGRSAAERGADPGLTIALNERRGVTWILDRASSTARRSTPRVSAREIDTCARCHSHRTQFSDEHFAGRPFDSAFDVTLISPGLYYADGQQRAEVFTHGSFLQSRMNAQGVTCSDCHEPHSGKPRASGNAVCAQCHVASRYDAPAHHHHEAKSEGAQCSTCHMPTTTYMLIDPRHDHSIRIPRPDRTVSMGAPNACNACHRDRSPEWADAAMQRWYPDRRAGFQTFAEAFSLAERGAPGARDALLAIVGDATLSPFVRASAIARLEPDGAVLRSFDTEGVLRDSDPTIRATAVRVLGRLAPPLRARALGPMLGDGSRLVRMQTAEAIMGPAETLPGVDPAQFQRALDEHLASLKFNADRPEALTRLGNAHTVRGAPERAAAAYRQALARDPTAVEASVNLAELHRAAGDEPSAERTLREAVKRNPQAAAARHALGLALVRQQRMPQALAELEAAMRLAPDNARYAYVCAIALHEAGRTRDAITALDTAVARHPYDRGLLTLLSDYALKQGDQVRSRLATTRLLELLPSNPQLKARETAPGP